MIVAARWPERKEPAKSQLFLLSMAVHNRSNWMFADTVGGVKASAHLYSLVQTARANELEPHAYLRRLFAELPSAQTVEQVEALLPWNIKSADSKTSEANCSRSTAYSV